MDRLPRRGRWSVPPRRLAPWHGQRIAGLIAAWALRTMQFASGVEPTIANLLVQIGKRVEYESFGDPNRCLLPADLLTPLAVAARTVRVRCD
jgi:hypothetical protein